MTRDSNFHHLQQLRPGDWDAGLTDQTLLYFFWKQLLQQEKKLMNTPTDGCEKGMLLYLYTLQCNVNNFE